MLGAQVTAPVPSAQSDHSREKRRRSGSEHPSQPHSIHLHTQYIGTLRSVCVAHHSKATQSREALDGSNAHLVGKPPFTITALKQAEPPGLRAENKSPSLALKFANFLGRLQRHKAPTDDAGPTALFAAPRMRASCGAHLCGRARRCQHERPAVLCSGVFRGQP